MSFAPGPSRRRTGGPVVLSACTVDLERERAQRGDEVIPLTTRETCLLRYLWEREGQDVPRAELLVEVWGYSPLAQSRTVDATMRRLRNKLERDPSVPDHLLTVWGAGYRFVASGSPAAATRDRLIGREAEVRAVAAAFDAGARLVTLVGPSGAGKTRLAQEVMNRFDHDARFCAVGDATDTASLVRVVARALDADPGVAAETVPPHLLTMRGDLLLVLDSVEHAMCPSQRPSVGHSPCLRDAATPRANRSTDIRLPAVGWLLRRWPEGAHGGIRQRPIGRRCRLG